MNQNAITVQSREERRRELMLPSRDKIKKKCKALKISGEGSKTEMVHRILVHIYDTNANNQPLPQRPQLRPPIIVTDDQNARDLQNRLRLQRRLKYKASSPIKRKSKPQNTSKIAPTVPSKPDKIKTYLTFRFVGLRTPNIYKKCVSDNIDNIKIKSLTIKSRLYLSSTISELKQFIKRIYSVPATLDILILYSHVIISNNNAAKLKHFGITNMSLLTLAISKDRYYKRSDHHSRNQLLHSLKVTKESTINDVQKGFDIITQQKDATLYKMPICAHYLSKQSLYDYAYSSFMDQANLYLKCPHTLNEEPEQKYGADTTSQNRRKWSCLQCTYINSGVNRTSYRRIKKCAMCGSAKPENISLATNQCNTIWHYSLIKLILCHNDSDEKSDMDGHALDFNMEKLELLSARNNVENNKSLNVQKCYHCETLYFKNKKHENRINLDGFRKFKTKCVFCMNCFCWNCGKKYTAGHQCDGSFRLQILDILNKCATKTVGYVHGVPSVRCCPNISCSQLISHVTACKHMKCRLCSTSFCFVCMKPAVNGRWQCGGSSDRCTVAPIQTLKSMNVRKKEAVELKKRFQLF